MESNKEDHFQEFPINTPKIQKIILHQESYAIPKYPNHFYIFSLTHQHHEPLSTLYSFYVLPPLDQSQLLTLHGMRCFFPSCKKSEVWIKSLFPPRDFFSSSLGRGLGQWRCSVASYWRATIWNFLYIYFSMISKNKFPRKHYQIYTPAPL